MPLNVVTVTVKDEMAITRENFSHIHIIFAHIQILRQTQSYGPTTCHRQKQTLNQTERIHAIKMLPKFSTK